MPAAAEAADAGQLPGRRAAHRPASVTSPRWAGSQAVQVRFSAGTAPTVLADLAEESGISLAAVVHESVRRQHRPKPVATSASGRSSPG